MRLKVLSCFDGISCGQLALQRAGFHDFTYFASEIDKFAIQVSRKNFPNMIHLGDIKTVRPEWFGQVDLLMGGSPCQGFSNAGKGLGFDDPRSRLFYDFCLLKYAIKPKFFLLENVKMKRADQDVISRLMGCKPIVINSADFSAQNRVRCYWTNIPVEAWTDRGILLRDVLEDDVSDGFVKCDKKLNPKRSNDKAGTLTAGAHSGGNHSDMDIIVFMKQRSHGFNKGREWQADKTPPLTSSCWHENNHVKTDPSLTWRRLSPIECERLQTLPDNYTAGVSNTQRYKQIGNGWTVDVIAHILKGMHSASNSR